MTAVGIPARPVKKDGVSIPRERKHVSVEEYQELKNEIEELREQVRSLQKALAAAAEEEERL